MNNSLKEWSYEQSAKKWAASHGGQLPNRNSREFLLFHGQLQRVADNKRKARKAARDGDAAQNKTAFDYANQIVELSNNPEKIKEIPEALTMVLKGRTKQEQQNFLEILGKTEELNGVIRPWIKLLYNSIRNTIGESKLYTVINAMQESVSPTTDSKYPWLRPLLGSRLSITEDDETSMPDTATMSNTKSSSVDTMGADSFGDNTSDTESPTDDFNLDDLDMPEDDFGGDDGSDDDFGSSSVGGLGGFSGGFGGMQDGEGGEEGDDAFGIGAATPNEKIIDVMFDPSGDLTKARVEVKNMDTGEVSYKDFSEVDVK